MTNELQSETRPADSYTQAFRVVLHAGARDGEWVTHVQCLTSDGKHNGYNWGHYFDNKAVALSDYMTRCAKYNLKP